MKKHSRVPSQQWAVLRGQSSSPIKTAQDHSALRQKYKLKSSQASSNPHLPQSSLFSHLKTQTTKILDMGNARKSSERRTPYRYSTGSRHNFVKAQEDGEGLKQRVARVNGIFRGEEGLEEWWERHGQYMRVVKEWRLNGSFEEVDELLYQLMQRQLHAVETIVSKMCQELTDKLNKYEQVIEVLVGQNQKLEEQVKRYRSAAQRVVQMEETLWDEKEKAQWSSFAVCDLERTGFDFENYLKSRTFYQNWVANHAQLPSQSDIPQSLMRPRYSSKLFSKLESKARSSLQQRTSG